ncbi:MAG: hypothetical protein H6Q68_227 [Firmicutes bacterium]|nr:hypothetical protein [Bacillota bacterium]
MFPVWEFLSFFFVGESMSVILVGADPLGSIERKLQPMGIESIEHITSRNVGDRKKFKCSLSTVLIVIFNIIYY